MSNAWCYGAIWPKAGQDAIDITQAIFDARHPSPDTEEAPLCRSRPDDERHRYSNHDARESKVWFRSPLVADPPAVTWTLDGDYSGGDAFFAGSSARTAQESREFSLAEARRRGKTPDWDFAFDYFPFFTEVYIVGADEEDLVRWSIQDEYLWVARHVFIPHGWASFMYFRFGEPQNTLGTVPGRPEPVQLPDRFMWVESEAWSLFDRPPTTT